MKDTKRYYILLKGKIHQENFTIPNIYQAPNIGSPTFIKQQINQNMIIVWDLNTLLSPRDRQIGHKLNRDILELNQTLKQVSLIDIYRIFYPNTKEYTFFSTTHGTFSKRDHILGHKASLHNFRKVEMKYCSSWSPWTKAGQLQQGKQQKVQKVLETKHHSI